MLITPDLVIIGSDGKNLEEGIGHVYAFERKTGKVRWKYLAGRGVPSDVLRYGDKIFAVTMDDELIGLNVHDGRRVWGFKSAFAAKTQEIGPSPVLLGGSIFWGGRDGLVYGLEANTGILLWKKNLGSAISTSLLAFENHIYVGAADGRIWGLHRATGAVEKNFSLPQKPVGKFAETSRRLFGFQNRSGALGTAEDLIGLNPAAQKIVWQRPASPANGAALKPALEAPANGAGNQCPIPETAWTSSRPYFWRDYILAGTNRGEVFAYRVADGRPA